MENISKIRITPEGIEIPVEVMEEISKLDEIKRKECMAQIIVGSRFVMDKANSALIFKTKNQRAVKKFPYLIKVLLKKLKINSPVDWNETTDMKYVHLENGTVIRNYSTFLDDEGFMNIKYEIRN